MAASAPVLCAFVWLIVANLLGMIPSRDGHRARAALLIVTGIPLLVWLIRADGLLPGLLFLGGALSVLRWPALMALRAIRRRLTGGTAPTAPR